jgi:antitoxin HicB
MKTLQYPARYRLDEDGIWEVWLPDINSDGIGVYTQGDTIEEAREMAREALTGCLLAKQDMGAPLDAPSALPAEDGWELVAPEATVEVALLVRKMRCDKSLTQQQAAALIGVPYTSYQRWEDPDKCNATIKTLERIARAFGAHLHVAFG